VSNRFGIETAGDDQRKAPVTVVLADDHVVVRNGLRALLEGERDLSVVAEASDVEAALNAAAEHRPDVVVLDLNMPGGPSLPAIRAIAEKSPRTAVVVLTMHNDPALAHEALQNGARGYVVKESASAELVNAIRTAAYGGTYLNPALAARVAVQAAASPDPPDDAVDGPTLARLADDLGGHDALHHLIRVYLDQASATIKTIDNAARARDCPAVKRAAHQLKSSTALLGATGLADLSSRLEIAGRTGDLKSVDRLVVAVMPEAERVAAALNAELDRETR